jgi:hypothetical protein
MLTIVIDSAGIGLGDRGFLLLFEATSIFVGRVATKDRGGFISIKRRGGSGGC